MSFFNYTSRNEVFTYLLATNQRNLVKLWEFLFALLYHLSWLETTVFDSSVFLCTHRDVRLISVHWHTKLKSPQSRCWFQHMRHPSRTWLSLDWIPGLTSRLYSSMIAYSARQCWWLPDTPLGRHGLRSKLPASGYPRSVLWTFWVASQDTCVYAVGNSKEPYGGSFSHYI